MEKIIDNMDDEDFEGIDLFTYTFLFKNMNDEQKEYVVSQFHDWDWSMGLHIAELKITKENEITKFIFKSPKLFEDKDSPDWNDDDIQNNILTKLVGKEQFIPTFQFSECGVDELEISFIDDQNLDYKVEVNKFSSLTKN